MLLRVLAAVTVLSLPLAAQALDIRIREVASATAFDRAQLRPGMIVFSDQRAHAQADPGTGFIPAADWARAWPVFKRHLSLYPAYEEPTVKVTVNGVTKLHTDKMHVYVAEASFALAKPPGSVDLANYASPAFLEKMDPAIKHKLIAAEDVVPAKEARYAANQNPERPWCKSEGATCIQSHYQLEGRLPTGIKLANKLVETGKKIPDYLEFQSELRIVPAIEIETRNFQELTGLRTPVAGAVEQSIFWVNQVMQYGKFLAVLQPHPTNRKWTVVTAFMVLGIKTSVIDRQKKYENVPVLRNLVPSQVLLGKSSFNTGTSISAGLPSYTRNRIKAIASIL
jgi:hypothetical protein